MGPVRLYLVETLVTMRVVAPAVEWGHILVGVGVSIDVLLSQDLLLLLWSSVCSWLLLLVHHKRCLRRLILVRIIEVREVRSVVCVKRVLPILESTLWLLLLILEITLHHSIIRAFWNQIIYSLLLLLLLILILLIWERVHRAVDCWFWILQVVRIIDFVIWRVCWQLLVIILSCFQHRRILSETTWLHEVWILVLLRWVILSALKLVEFTKLGQLWRGVVVGREPLVVSLTYVRLIIEIFGLCCGSKLTGSELVIERWHHLLSLQLHPHFWIHSLHLLGW